MSLLFGENPDRQSSRRNRSGIDAFRRGNSAPCPSCGATIGLNEPHSYRAILTDSVRTHLNGLLLNARNFTRGLDSFLARLSNRLELCDPYGTPYVREELSHLIGAGLIERATWLDLTSDITGNPDSEAAQERRQRTADMDRAERANVAGGDGLDVDGSLRETVYQQLVDDDAVAVVRKHQNVYGVLSSETAAGHWAEYFQLQLDTHDFDHNFTNFPLLDSTSVDDKEKCRRYAKLLLGPALERRGNALLLNLVEEQPAILEYLQSGKLGKHRETVKRLVAQLRPELGRYYDFIERHLGQFDDTEAGAIRKNLERARFLLLILHGHGWRMLSGEVRTEFETALGGDFEEFGRLFLRDLYALSDQTEISGELLSQMVAARIILQIENRTLVNWLPEWVRELFRTVTSRLFRRNDERNWLQYIGNLIVVQCANQIEANRTILVPDTSPASDTASHQTTVGEESDRSGRSRIDSLAGFFSRPRRPERMREETVRVFVPCSYALSECPTYSIVLLGSPGTGKTTAFEAGLAKLWRVAEGLGLELMPVDPESTSLIEQIQNQFFGGRIQKPTEVNLALNFEARLIREPEKRIRVSVIDVPGEKVNALASGKGADSELRRILRHANTIVFQFDLWSDKTLWRQLAASGSGEFESQLQLAATLEASRREKEGYFSDQSLLLSRLIAMLESERPRAELDEMNFVCLFPKIDTLTSNNGNPALHLIFSDLMKTLQTQELLVHARFGTESHSRQGQADSNSTSRSRTAVGFGGLESLAGLGLAESSPLFNGAARNNNNVADGDPHGASNEGHASGSSFARQVAICRALSESTKRSLERLGDMLPSGTPLAAKVAFSGRVRNGVIGKVETHFRSSFFLPVSALGRTPTPEENEQRRIDRPNSVLVEYAFLLPLMAAFEESYPNREV